MIVRCRPSIRMTSCGAAAYDRNRASSMASKSGEDIGDMFRQVAAGVT